MSKPEFVYVIYIASTPEKVFAALTDAKMSEQYWAGNRVVSDWKIGAAFALKLKREETDVTGTVLEYDTPWRPLQTFDSQHGGMQSEPPSRVTFEIEQQKDQVNLTIVHDGFEPGSKAFEGISRGWPFVLSSLKSYLEAGKVLRAHWCEDEDADRGAT